MYALIDCNNFYVACERLFDPALYGKPVGVLSNNDGCIVARSEELKALGVAMGTPAHLLPPELAHHGLVLRSSNYTLYGDLSERVQRVLAAEVPEVDPYSIDEYFLDLKGITKPLEPLAQRLAGLVERRVGIPVSVGIAPTRTLAKLANHCVKQRNRHHSDIQVFRKADDPGLIQWLQNMPPGAVWGIGGRLNARLMALGIDTAFKLRNASPGWLRHRFNVVLARTASELKGDDCLAPDGLLAARHSIRCSRSFGRVLTNPAQLGEALRFHCERAGVKLRREGQLASLIGISLTPGPFDRTPRGRNGHRHGLCHWLTLPFPTADTVRLNLYAQQLLKHLYQPGQRYQKIAVMLEGLSPQQGHQPSLFEGSESGQRLQLMKTWDDINQRYGATALTLGPRTSKADWQMRSAHRSGRFTTHMAELPQVTLR